MNDKQQNVAVMVFSVMFSVFGAIIWILGAADVNSAENNRQKIAHAAYEDGIREGQAYGVCWMWATVMEYPRYPKQAQADADAWANNLEAARARH